jgi:hypothetical protein
LQLAEHHFWAFAVLIAFDVLALAMLFVVSRRKTEGGLRWRWGDR